METAIITAQQTSFTPALNMFKKFLAFIEWFRIRNHLRIVEKELLRKNIGHLSPELRQERTRNITRLHEYWVQGLYPKNTDFSDRRVPYFKDAVHTPCAMAYLIEQSGRQDLVDAVVHSNNHVYINDLQDGPVMDWIHSSGLTKAEAARVQPSYASSPIVEFLPWIVGSVSFVLLEWLCYEISSWIASDNSKRRMAALSYFTLNNVVLAFIISVIFTEYTRGIWY